MSKSSACHQRILLHCIVHVILHQTKPKRQSMKLTRKSHQRWIKHSGKSNRLNYYKTEGRRAIGMHSQSPLNNKLRSGRHERAVDKIYDRWSDSNGRNESKSLLMCFRIDFNYLRPERSLCKAKIRRINTNTAKFGKSANLPFG